jgi:hypothetical protein
MGGLSKACGAAMLLMGGAWALGSTCYHLQRSGCGTGPKFCVEGNIICDIGYGSTMQTGCGRQGPLQTESRGCYKITDAVTYPCTAGQPPGEYTVGGCEQNGVCCWVRVQFHSTIAGAMSVPQGATCQCGGGGV